jgi:glutathione synthase/RimK-type ligase-like ATP-grasp enzyme
MRKDGKVRFATGYRFDLNSDAAAGIAQDKVATYELLHDAGLPVVQHILFRYDLKDDNSLTSNSKKILKSIQAMLAYPWVIKPLNGNGATGVNLITTNQALIDELPIYTDWAIAISPLQDASAEYRVVVLEDTVLLAFKKIADSKALIESDEYKLKLFNLGFDAQAEDITEGETFNTIKDLAIKAARELQLRQACVDIFETPDGLKIIEVNDSLMLEHYCRSSADRAEKAKEIYSKVVTRMFQ